MSPLRSVLRRADLILVLLALTTLPARAEPITIAFSGLLSAANSDAAALMNLAPSSIVGTPITGTIVYDTADFGAASPAGPGYDFWDSTDGSLPLGAIIIDETINGQTFQWNGTYYNALLDFDQTNQYEDSSYSNGVEFTSEDPNAYGDTAAELFFFSNNPSLTNGMLNPAGPFNLGVAVQSAGLYFASYWNTSSLKAEWDFETTSAAIVPEPEVAMFLPALAGLVCLRGRRLRLNCSTRSL